MEVPESFFNVEFNKAVAFGYKTDDVDVFVTKAIELIKGLQEENEVLQNKLGVLAGSLEKYREDEESLRAALIGAQKLGDSILKDSRSKAEVILRDATTKADHIVAEAHTRLHQEVQEYERVKTEVTAFREALISMYKAHIDQIYKIPHTERAPAQQAPAQLQQEPRAIAQPEAVREPEPPARPTPPAPKEPPRKEAVAPEPAPVERATHSSPTLQLELEEDDEGNFEEEVILSKFSHHANRMIQEDDEPDGFDDDDDEDDNLQPLEKRAVYSPKFGELKFGESFSLTTDGDRPTRLKK